MAELPACILRYRLVFKTRQNGKFSARITTMEKEERGKQHQSRAGAWWFPKAGPGICFSLVALVTWAGTSFWAKTRLCWLPTVQLLISH